MTRSRYELALSATVIEAARTAVGEELPHRLPVMQEPPPEIRELIARLAVLDSVKQRAAERRVVASLQLRLPLP
jgi:hypothetical protein